LCLMSMQDYLGKIHSIAVNIYTHIYHKYSYNIYIGKSG